MCENDRLTRPAFYLARAPDDPMRPLLFLLYLSHQSWDGSDETAESSRWIEVCVVPLREIWPDDNPLMFTARTKTRA